MSAGPSIVSSPAWTGPSRSIFFFCFFLQLFVIKPTVEHISQSSIWKLFPIIKMSILKKTIYCVSNIGISVANWLLKQLSFAQP